MSQIKGRFVFQSNRFSFTDVFITENGKTRLLLKMAGYPVWSTNGKMIVCASFNSKELKKFGFWIIDPKDDKKEFIEMPLEVGIPTNFNWSLDDKKIYYACGTPKELNKNKIYCYDFLLKTHTKIMEFEEKFNILALRLSPKGDKFIISGLSHSTKNNCNYLSNSDGSNLRLIGNYKGDGPWYPDNEYVAYDSNVSEDGQMIISQQDWAKKGWGYFFKMNVSTGEVERLQLCNIPFLMNLKISRDGKYYYYAASVKGGGRAICVSPIDDPNKMTQITKPVPMVSVAHHYSQDSNPDWYQD